MDGYCWVLREAQVEWPWEEGREELAQQWQWRSLSLLCSYVVDILDLLALVWHCWLQEKEGEGDIRDDATSIICHHHRCRRHQVPAACDRPSCGWTRNCSLILLFFFLFFLLQIVALMNPVNTGWCIIPCVCVTTLRRSKNFSTTIIIMSSAKLERPVLYSLLTSCSIFCCMNAITLFSFPCCLHNFMILYQEPQWCLLTTDICWQ